MSTYDFELGTFFHLFISSQVKNAIFLVGKETKIKTPTYFSIDFAYVSLIYVARVNNHKRIIPNWPNIF